jgi:hypothetical protein
MYTYDSVAVKGSILAECGLRIKKDCVELVATQLFEIAKLKLEEELEQNFSIKDLVNPDMTSQILDTYLKYFILDSNFGGYIVYRQHFLSSKNGLSNSFIKNNVDYFVEIFSQYLETGLSAKDIAKIPEVYLVLLGKKSFGKYYYLLSSSGEGPFEKYFKGSYLRESIVARNASSLFDLAYELNLITDERRVIAYQNVITKIRNSYRWRTADSRQTAHANMYQELIKLIKDVEPEVFGKSESYVERLIESLPFN